MHQRTTVTHQLTPVLQRGTHTPWREPSAGMRPEAWNASSVQTQRLSPSDTHRVPVCKRMRTPGSVSSLQRESK